MGILQLRDLVPFPGNGDNLTDTVVNGVHFNRTALEAFNYTLYSNNTISNDSNCYLIFGPYQPAILNNGTMVNGTNCSAPILPLKTRGKLGAVFGALFGISIMFTLVNLKRHGQQFLREDKRFRLVGRRWQWYWMLIAAGCGMISTITAIDVDRNYLQDLAIILQGFFFMCLGQATVAVIWEGVRHWGSWQERQICDRDPFSLPQDDRRGKMEFYMPLAFYFFDFMSFFFTAPRSWSKIPKQSSLQQQNAVAKPVATDVRFKLGSILLACAWLVIIYCVQHNLFYYRLRAHPARAMGSIKVTSAATAIRFLPIKYTMAIIVVLVRIAYGIAQAFDFSISVLKFNADPVWPYLLGYLPCVIVLIVFNIWGFIDKNEDKELIRQRVERGQIADRELGIKRKPNWWSKSGGDHHLDDMSRLRGLVASENIHSNEHNANAPRNRTERHSQISRMSRGWSDMEMMNMQSPTSPGFSGPNHPPPGYADALRTTPYRQGSDSSSTQDNRGRRVSSMLFPDSPLSPGDQPSWLGREHSPGQHSMASAATGTTLANPQQVKSMLDI